MPIQKKPLNNVPPPTWANADGSTPAPDGSVTTTTTKLRWIDNQDKVNYFTAQREQGDLFFRDFWLDSQLNSLIDFVGLKTGLTFQAPLTRLGPSKYISLAKFTQSTLPNMVIVALQCRTTGTPSSNIFIEVINIGTSTVIESSDSTHGSNHDALVFDGTVLIPTGTQFEIRLVNNSGATADVEGFVVLQGRTY